VGRIQLLEDRTGGLFTWTLWRTIIFDLSDLKKMPKLSNIYFFIYLRGWSGTQSAVTAAIYWPIVPALDATR
jgi:hypothetical protein